VAEGGPVQRLRCADGLRAGAVVADRDFGDVAEQFDAGGADAADFAAVGDGEQVGVL
jgi:hypothetical protein